MSSRKVGFWVAFAFMLVSLGRIHEIIPGLSGMMLGGLTTLILCALVAMESPHLKWNRVLVWRILFFLSLLPGLAIGYDHKATLLIVRSEFASTFAFFLGGLLFFRTVSDLRKLQNALIVICAVFSLWMLAHNGHGPGLLEDENDAALAVVMLLPFPLFKLFEKIRPVWFTANLLIFFAALAGIGSTISRGGMLGALTVLGACWFRSRHKSPTLVILVLLVAAVIVLAPEKGNVHHQASLVQEFSTISDTHEETADERLWFWSLSRKIFMEKPVFGVGANAWGTSILHGVVSTDGRELHNNTTHSVYYQALSELGLFGTITWLGLLASCLFCFRDILPNRLRREAGLAMAGVTDPRMIREIQERQKFFSNFGLALGIGLLGFLVSGTFLSVLYYPQFCTFACLLQASKESWRRELALFTVLGLRAENRGRATPSQAWALASGTLGNETVS
jgi:O-antigen ligase